MQKFSKFLMGLAAMFTMAGCLSRNFAESTPALSTSDDQITVDAASTDGSGVYYDLTVTANQSWGCVVSSTDGKPVDWLSAGTIEHTNLNGVSEECLVRLSFDDNSINKARFAQLKLTTHDCEKSVSITQNALAYTLDVSSPKQVDVPCNEVSVTVSVVCNTEWKAAVKNGATASVTLDRTGGYGNDDIAVKFAANEDITATKAATLVLSAEDCADVEVVFTQAKCIPNVTVDREKTSATINYTDKVARIYFNANMDWEASYSGTFKNASLSRTEGTSADTYIDLNLDAKYVWEDLTGTVTFKLKGEDKSDSITLTQTGGMYIYIPFNTADAATLWSPALDATLKKNVIKGAHTYTPNGFTLNFNSTNAGGMGFYQANGMCFDFDAATTSWIEIPCPPEASVKSVEIKCLNTSNKKFTIYDSVSATGAGGTVLGATATLNNKVGAWGEGGTAWTKAPAKGESVCLMVTKQKNAMISYLTVTFE